MLTNGPQAAPRPPGPQATQEVSRLPLYLTEADVERVLTMDKALELVENAFRDQGHRKLDNMPRWRGRASGHVLSVLAAALPERHASGLKAYTVTRQGTRFYVLIFDDPSGDFVALIEGDRLGQMRTGAATGVATRALSRPDSRVLTVFGSGWQAEAQVLAVAAVRELDEIRVVSRQDTHAQAFVDRMQGRVRPRIRVAEPGDALDGADIVVTVTSADSPLFAGTLLPEGVHVNAAGSNQRHHAELDALAVSRAQVVVVDDVEGARRESGDLIAAEAAGVFRFETARLLGDVLVNPELGRQDDRDITLFESQGIAALDVAVGRWVYDAARHQGLGTPFGAGSGR